jgi:hypothetical protein
MIVWGFFSAIGWMAANWTVNQVFPDTPPAVIQPEKKEDTSKQEKKSN